MAAPRGGPRRIGTNGLSGVSFVDASHGWAVGIHNTLLVTSDGGVSWNPENPGIAHDGNLSAVQFLDARHGWIVGEQGRHPGHLGRRGHMGAPERQAPTRTSAR